MYKRQDEINAILSGITDSRQKTVCSYALHRVGFPVSYTHLDVYKRQHLHSVFQVLKDSDYCATWCDCLLHDGRKQNGCLLYTSQMDEVVAKINHQNERYDALNKKLSEIETSKDDEEVRERLVKENQDKDALINLSLIHI